MEGGGGILPWSNVVMCLYYYDRFTTCDDVLGQATLIQYIMLFSDDHVIQWWSCYSVMVMLFGVDHVIRWWSCYAVMIMLFGDDHAIQWWSCYSVMIMLCSDDHVIQWWSCYAVMVMLFSDDHAIQWWSCYSLMIMLFSDDHVFQWWSCYSVMIILFSASPDFSHDDDGGGWESQRCKTTIKFKRNPEKKVWEFNDEHDIVLWGRVPTRKSLGYRPYIPYIRGDEEVRIKVFRRELLACWSRGRGPNRHCMPPTTNFTVEEGWE